MNCPDVGPAANVSAGSLANPSSVWADAGDADPDRTLSSTGNRTRDGRFTRNLVKDLCVRQPCITRFCACLPRRRRRPGRMERKTKRSRLVRRSARPRGGLTVHSFYTILRFLHNSPFPLRRRPMPSSRAPRRRSSRSWKSSNRLRVEVVRCCPMRVTEWLSKARQSCELKLGFRSRCE